MSRTLLPIGFLALLLTTAPVLAHDRASASAPQPDLTRAQALNRADTLFATFDVNHDGLVTRAEAEAVGEKLLLQRVALHRDVAPGIGGHTLHYMERTFAHAQAVTLPQFEAAMLAHFDDMDVNRDAILTAAERAGAGGHVVKGGRVSNS